MATEKILLEVNLSAKDATENAANLKRAIIDTEKEIAALRKATEGNTGAQKAAAGSFAKLEAQLKTQKKEYSDNVREIQNLDRINKGATGSIEQMRAALSVLTKQYNGLSQAERETSTSGKALQSQIKNLSDKLKEQEQAVGDTRRNVGNYAEAFKSLPGPLGKVSQGVSGFNTTLKANPILLVVSLLVQFAQQLGKNAKVADTVNAVFEGLNKTFQFIIDTVVDLFTNVDKLGAALLNPVKFIRELAGGAKDAAVNGYEASRAMDAFTTSAGKLNNEISKNEKTISELENKLLNISLSFEQRKKIAEDLANLEISNAQKRASIADEELRIQEQLLKGKTLNNEEEQMLADLTQAAENSRLEEKIANEQKATRIAKLLYKEEIADKRADREADQQTEEEKLIEHRKKLDEIGDKFAEDESKKYQQYLEKKSEAEEAYREKVIQDRADTFNKEISLINQRLEYEEIVANNEIKNTEDLNKKKLDLKIAALEKELELTIKYLGADGVITQAEALGIAKIQELITGLKQQLIPNEEEPTLAQSIGLTEEDVEKATEVLGQIKQGLGALQEIINAGYQTKLNQIDATTTAEIAAVNASTASEEEKKKKISAIEKKAAKEKYELEKKQFETNKTFQIINAVIAGALAIVQSFAQLGPIAGAIAAVLIGATTIAQVSTISSQQPPAPPSFMEGGFTEQGNPNEVATNLGLKDYTYHKSEYVTPAHILATPEGQYHVSQLESMRLAKRSGRKYLGGMADGGFAIRNATGATSQTQQMIDGILAGVQELPAPIVRVTEINRVNRQVNDIVVSSELR